MLTKEEERYIAEHINDDVQRLALSIKPNDSLRKDLVLQQIAGYQRLKDKIPSWTAISGLVYPRQISTEQCSSEVTARYKAHLAQSGNTMIDLTGGFGVDFIFMSEGYLNGVYIEQSDELCQIARHNFNLLRKKETTIVCGDGIEYASTLNVPVDLIYIDPARRDKNGGKVVRINDCIPDLTEIEELLTDKAKRVIAKLSPMLDIDDTLHRLKHINEIHIVSVNNECKELLLVLDRDTHNEVKVRTVNITDKQQQIFDCSPTDDTSNSCHYTSIIEKYLYEPNSSIMKAGAFKSITTAFPVSKLHVSSHLYTNSVLVENFPGRKFEVIETYGFSKRDIQTISHKYPNANITVRNFPLRPDEIRKKLKLKDGGSVYIFATTTNDNRHILIICKKANTTQ